MVVFQTSSRLEAGGGQPAASEVHSKARPKLGTSSSVNVLQVCLRIYAFRPVVEPPHVVVVQNRRRSATHAAEQALQRVLESFSKLLVEVSVYDGVQRRVEVPHPKHQRHHDIGVGTFRAQGRDDVPQEER